MGQNVAKLTKYFICDIISDAKYLDGQAMYLGSTTVVTLPHLPKFLFASEGK